MNGFFEIIAEGAMLEAAVAEKYLLTGVNEANVGEYISDKAYAAGQTIKKLYEKVMNVIDEVINKVLNYKDEKMLGFAATKFKKYKFDPTKKTVEFRAEVVHVERLAGLVDHLKENCKFPDDVKDVTEDPETAESLSKKDKDGYEKEMFKDIEAGLNKKLNTQVSINSFADLQGVYRKTLVEKEAKVTLTAELYNNAYDFITAKKENSVASLLKKLRDLKMDIKRAYQLILRDLSEEVRAIKKDKDDDRDVKNIKKNGKWVLKLYFNALVASIIAAMGVIRDGVKYCRIMAKAIATKSEKIKSDDKKEEVKAENSSALSFLESAIAESELDLY